MKTALLIFSFSSLLISSTLQAAPATPPERKWSLRAAWQPTVLGEDRPKGFGITGGHTGYLGLSRALRLSDRYRIDFVGSVRGFGFEQPRERTVGFEVDAGLEATWSPLKLPLGFTGGLAMGGFRDPFMTAIGPMRFIGIRPSITIGATYQTESGVGARFLMETRCYDTLVWGGCTFSPFVGGSFAW